MQAQSSFNAGACAFDVGCNTLRLPQSAMAVSAGLEALVLDQSRVGVLCAGVVLTKQRAIIRVSRINRQ